MNIRVGYIVSKIKKSRSLIRGFIRCRIWSLCPKCNSDAPEKDSCPICMNFYGHPDKHRKQLWWYKFQHLIKNKS